MNPDIGEEGVKPTLESFPIIINADSLMKIFYAKHLAFSGCKSSGTIAGQHAIAPGKQDQ